MVRLSLQIDKPEIAHRNIIVVFGQWKIGGQ
jgi:hypothetical protein